MNIYTYCANNPVNFVDPYGLSYWGNFGAGFSLRWSDVGTTIWYGALKAPSKLVHDTRNIFNNQPLQKPTDGDLGWTLLEPEKAAFHQYNDGREEKGCPNLKYVNENGSEAVYDHWGNIVTRPDIKASYNFDPNPSSFGHSSQDILPWIIWGNAPEDTTTASDRLGQTVSGFVDLLKSKL